MNAKTAIALSVAMALLLGATSTEAPVSIVPARLPPIATVNEGYQSYNIEMAEVIGGKANGRSRLDNPVRLG